MLTCTYVERERERERERRERERERLLEAARGDQNVYQR